MLELCILSVAHDGVHVQWLTTNPEHTISQHLEHESVLGRRAPADDEHCREMLDSVLIAETASDDRIADVA